MKVIDNYAALPLGKFQDIVALCKDESLTDLDREISILAILGDCTEDDILALPLAEFSQAARAAAFLEEEAKAPTGSRVATRYVLGDFTLAPVTDIFKITAAQYIDFKTLVKAEGQHLPEILGCFLVPVGRQYNRGYDVAQVQDAIRQGMMVTEALGLVDFFLSRLHALMEDFLTSLAAQARRMQPAERKRTQELMARLRTIFNPGGDGSPM